MHGDEPKRTQEGKTVTRGAMNVDDVLRAECEAELKIREILLDLERSTGMELDFVRVDRGCSVNVTLKQR